MVNCCVKKCRTYTTKGEKGVRFFRLPTITEKFRGRKKKLTLERLKKWLEVLGLPEDNVKSYKRICNKHFVNGCPAKLMDTKSIDWLPTLNLNLIPPNEITRVRRKKEPVSVDESSPKIEFVGVIEPFEEEPLDSENEIKIFALSKAKHRQAIIKRPKKCASSQTNLTFHPTKTNNETAAARIIIKEDNMRTINELNLKIMCLREELNQQKFDLNYFRNADEKLEKKKIEYFTGLPDSTALYTIYEFISLPATDVLTSEQMFVMTLMKLRLNFEFRYLAYKFNVTPEKAFKYFCQTVVQIYADAKQIITWLDRIYIREAAPSHFRKISKRRVTFVIDILEIPIEKPITEELALECFSPTKKTFTLKCLIVFAPIGSVMFVSEAFGGKYNNKSILEKSEFIDLIDEGDIVLAQKDFLMNYRQSSKDQIERVQALTKFKSTLIPFDITDNDKMLIVQKDVDNITNIIRQKYLILSNRINNAEFAKTFEEKNKWVQQIATVCCVLVNLTIEQPELDDT